MKRKRNILDELNCKISQSNTIMQNKKTNLKIDVKSVKFPLIIIIIISTIRFVALMTVFPYYI